MFHNYFWDGGMWFGGFFWIIIIVLIVWAVSNSNHKRGHHDILTDLETPIEILKKRYAKGEITKEQFDQMKKDLE